MSTDPTFRMSIIEVYAIDGLGTVAAGQIDLGTINQYDDVWLHGNNGVVKTGVAAIQAGAKRVKTAKAGEMVALVLRGLAVDRIQPGNHLSGSDS